MSLYDKEHADWPLYEMFQMAFQIDPEKRGGLEEMTRVEEYCVGFYTVKEDPSYVLREFLRLLNNNVSDNMEKLSIYFRQNNKNNLYLLCSKMKIHIGLIKRRKILLLKCPDNDLKIRKLQEAEKEITNGTREVYMFKKKEEEAQVISENQKVEKYLFLNKLKFDSVDEVRRNLEHVALNDKSIPEDKRESMIRAVVYSNLQLSDSEDWHKLERDFEEKIKKLMRF
jgi:hypothetical protein